MDLIKKAKKEFRQASTGDKIMYIGTPIYAIPIISIFAWAVATGNLDVFTSDQNHESSTSYQSPSPYR